MLRISDVVSGEAPASESGRIMAAFNQVMSGHNNDQMEKCQAMVEKIERIGREMTGHLSRLEEKNQSLQELELVGKRMAGQDVQEVESRVREMASLLQVANKALLATGQAISREASRPGTPAGRHTR